jgi:hypothetical protein
VNAPHSACVLEQRLRVVQRLQAFLVQTHALAGCSDTEVCAQSLHAILLTVHQHLSPDGNRLLEVAGFKEFRCLLARVTAERERGDQHGGQPCERVFHHPILALK